MCCVAGHLVSGFVKQHLPILLVSQFTSQPSEQNALKAGFLEVDAALAESRIDCEFSGSTCVVVYMKVGGRMGVKIAAKDSTGSSYEAVPCVDMFGALYAQSSEELTVISTAAMQGCELNAAWVGDSRGVVGRQVRKSWEAVELTHDHKPTNPEERARIQRSRGRVERLTDESGTPLGPWRVWLEYAWCVLRDGERHGLASTFI